MPFVFGRETSEPHAALAIPAAELKASADPIEQAIGINLLFDWRVSEARAAHFYDFTKKPSTGPQLLGALTYYAENCIAVHPPKETYQSAANQEVRSPFLILKIIAINRLKEVGLLHFKHPQEPLSIFSRNARQLPMSSCRCVSTAMSRY